MPFRRGWELISDLGKSFPIASPSARAKPHHSSGTFFAFHARGHTLVELAIALAVIGVLVGIGWGVFIDRVTTYRMYSVGRMLQTDLTTLRSLAIDTNREARLHFVEADVAMDPTDVQLGAWDLQLGNRASGSTEWDTLPLDVEGVVDVSEGERNLGEGGNNETKGISLASWGTLDDDSIVFSPRGWIANSKSSFVGGYITVEIVNKRALGMGGDEHVTISVARSGYVHSSASESQDVSGNAVGDAGTSGQ